MTALTSLDGQGDLPRDPAMVPAISASVKAGSFSSTMRRFSEGVTAQIPASPSTVA